MTGCLSIITQNSAFIILYFHCQNMKCDFGGKLGFDFSNYLLPLVKFSLIAALTDNDPRVYLKDL